MATHEPRKIPTGKLMLARPSDRRDSYRFDVRGEARLQLPAAGQLQVADVSGSGMALHVPRRHLETLDRGHARFQLGADLSFEASFDTVSTCMAGLDRLRVGTRFRSLSRNASRKLSKFLFGELMVRSRSASRPFSAESALVSEDREFLAALVRFHGISLRRPLVAYVGDRALPNALAVTDVVAGERIQVVSLETLPVELHAGAELPFLLSAAGSALWFRAVVRFAEPHRAELTFPDRIVRSGFRDSFRSSLTGGDLEVRFQHPRLPVTVSKTALDISARGLSFPLDLRQDMLYPGDHLTPLLIRLPQGLVKATGIVRSVRQLTSGGMGCGVELIEQSDPLQWASAVFRNGHPNTLLGDDDAPAGAWRALDSSGYVSLWTHPTSLESARREFQKEWQGMPKRHGHLLVVKRDQRAVGTIAANRLYRRTWMMHLLGVDKAVRETENRASFYAIARELYSGLAFMLQHLTDLKYLVVYFATDSRWNDALHTSFEREYPIRAHLACSKYAIYRTSDGEPRLPTAAATAGLQVRALNALDLDAVAGALEQRFTPQECDAYDYRPDLLLNHEFSWGCRTSGYERSREIFVVEDEQQRRVGLLMMETGAERVNLFNLLNTCRFIPLPAACCNSDDVRSVALEHTRRYYERVGKRSHLLFDYSQQQSEEVEHPGYHYLCDGLAWMMHRDALPPWLSYIDDLLGIKSDPLRRSQ